MAFTERQTNLLIALWVLTPLVIFTVALRTFTSIRVFHRLDSADLLMICAAIGTLVAAVIETYAIHLGTGLHIWTIPVSQLLPVLKYQGIGSMVSFIPTLLGRVSLGFYLLRFTHGFHAHRIFCLGLVVLIVVVGVIEIAASSTALALCLPKGQDFIVSKRCSNSFIKGYNRFTLFVGVFYSAVDFMFSVFPATLLSHMQAPLKLKLGLIALLGLSLLAGIASIIRAKLIWDFFFVEDRTYNFFHSILLLFIENAVIIVTASAPPIRPLFKKRNQNSQSRTSQYTPMTQPQRRVDLTEAGLVEPELQDIGGFSKASQSDHPSIETQSTSRI